MVRRVDGSTRHSGTCFHGYLSVGYRRNRSNLVKHVPCIQKGAVPSGLRETLCAHVDMYLVRAVALVTSYMCVGQGHFCVRGGRGGGACFNDGAHRSGRD